MKVEFHICISRKHNTLSWTLKSKNNDIDKDIDEDIEKDIDKDIYKYIDINSLMRSNKNTERKNRKVS